MDHFGIGNAMAAMVRVYQQSARRTGRTTAMLNNLKNGDRVVCAEPKEARRLEQMARERGLTVEFLVIPPRQAQEIFSKRTSEGRTIFDHSWVEQYFERAVEQAANDIDLLQTQSSGYGEPHRDTRSAAIEISRWKIR